MKDERTLKAMKNLKRLLAEGKSIPQIAKMHNISSSTLYKSLDEAARAEGCSRDEFLSRPGAGNPYGSLGRYAAKLPIIDPQSTMQGFKEAAVTCSEIRKSIQAQLRKLGD